MTESKAEWQLAVEYFTTHFVVKDGPNKAKNQYGHLELWWAATSINEAPDASTNPWMLIGDAQNSYSLAAMGELASVLDALAAAPSPPPSAAVTEGMVEAGARAIAVEVDSPNCRQFDECVMGTGCQCRIDARLALQATLAVAPQGHGGRGKGDGWRPIETAPKDDKPVDLWCEHFDKDIKPFRVTDVRWNEDSRMYPRGWWRCSGNVLMTRLEAVLTPTHWMPLPDAPSASRRAEPAPDAGREGK